MDVDMTTIVLGALGVYVIRRGLNKTTIRRETLNIRQPPQLMDHTAAQDRLNTDGPLRAFWVYFPHFAEHGPARMVRV